MGVYSDLYGLADDEGEKRSGFVGEGGD